MVRFSERETCKVAELYRQCECLWNVNNVNYKNRQVKQATCEAIAREMNIENFTAADVKTKIKSLRSTYKLELMKIRRLVEAGSENCTSNLKWFSIMDSIFKKMENCQSPVDNPSLENGKHTPEGIFPDDSQWEQQSGSSLEIASVSVSSAASEPEIEQSVRSISDPEVVTVTPEIQSVQSLSNSEVYSVIPEVQSVQPVSHSQVLTATPEILTIKAVSKPEVIPVTSEIKTVTSVSSPETITATSGIQQTIKSVSDSAVTTVPSGIQTAKSALPPKFFALVPDIQTSKSISNPRFITVSAGNNQNVRYVSGSPGIALAPEIQQRVNQVSADETLRHRKRRREEVSSTDSNNRTVIGDFSDRSEDEMDAFGHFVAMNLRKMSMQSALSAQSEILSVLTRHRLNDSATNLPSKQTFPCIVTNGSSPPQNPVVLQKLFLKS